MRLVGNKVSQTLLSLVGGFASIDERLVELKLLEQLGFGVAMHCDVAGELLVEDGSDGCLGFVDVGGGSGRW
jgi:hypothetical protein